MTGTLSVLELLAFDESMNIPVNSWILLLNGNNVRFSAVIWGQDEDKPLKGLHRLSSSHDNTHAETGYLHFRDPL